MMTNIEGQEGIYTQPASMAAYQNYQPPVPIPVAVVSDPALNFMETEGYYLSAFEWQQGRVLL